MLARTVRLLTAVALAMPLARGTSSAQEGIRIADFMGTRSMSLTATSKPVRRGETSTITIAKNFIDLVASSEISVSGATKGTVSRGRNSGGTGFISFPVAVSGTATVGGGDYGQGWRLRRLQVRDRAARTRQHASHVHTKPRYHHLRDAVDHERHGR